MRAARVVLDGRNSAKTASIIGKIKHTAPCGHLIIRKLCNSNCSIVYYNIVANNFAISGY